LLQALRASKLYSFNVQEFANLGSESQPCYSLLLFYNSCMFFG
jgi:hypothetical protein